MDTAAEAMLNYATLKNKTRHCELARSLTAVPLYVQPGYGHNVCALARLRKAAAHMIIQQFRGEYPSCVLCVLNPPIFPYSMIPFLEKINYVYLQVSPIHWYVVRTNVKTIETFPHLQDDALPSSFKGPPKFKEAHMIVLSKRNILTCSCGHKHRYGIPCRHLFSVEPEYDLGDIDYRYQVTYSYYAYHPNHGDVTKAFKARHAKEHNGIQRKTLVIQEDLPYLSNVTPYTADEILNLYSSNVPECWNYKPREYPESFAEIQDNHQGPMGDLTQESTANYYDSDGVIVVDDPYSDDQEEELTPTDSMAGLDDTEVATNAGGPRESVLTDAQLISKFKSVLNAHKTQTSKQELWKMLTNAEHKEKRKILENTPGLLGEIDEEFISLHLPLDHARESVQHAYRKTKYSRKKRKR